MIRNIKDINKFMRVISKINADERIKLARSLKDFPIRINERVLKLAKSSTGIYKQFIPTSMEADSLFKNKVYKPRFFPVKGVEMAYSNRAIITPVYDCESYCRYCFLREKSMKQKPLSKEELDQAIRYIKDKKEIKYLLITGGDPMINYSKLEQILLGLKEVSHLDSIRIGTRTILFDPSKFNQNFFNLISEVRKNKKRVEIGAHMNHPDEIDKEARKCLERLAKNQITVYTQTVLLKGINDKSKTLLKLYEKVYAAGGEIYILFHCDPIRGGEHFRTNISKGLEIKSELADLTSGRLIPQYKVAKCEIGVDSEVLMIKDNHILIKTPYSIKNLKKNIPGFKLNKSLESISDDGKLVITYFGRW